MTNHPHIPTPIADACMSPSAFGPIMSRANVPVDLTDALDTIAGMASASSMASTDAYVDAIADTLTDALAVIRADLADVLTAAAAVLDATDADLPLDTLAVGMRAVASACWHAGNLAMASTTYTRSHPWKRQRDAADA